MDAAARLDPEAKSIVPRRQGHRAEPPWPRAAGAERGGRQMGREEEAASPRHGRRGGGPRRQLQGARAELAASYRAPLLFEPAAARLLRSLPASAGVGHAAIASARASPPRPPHTPAAGSPPRCAGRRGLWRAPAVARRPSPAREGREREGRAWPDPGRGSSARPPAEGGGRRRGPAPLARQGGRGGADPAASAELEAAGAGPSMREVLRASRTGVERYLGGTV